MTKNPYIILTCLFLITLIVWKVIDYFIKNEKIVTIDLRSGFADGLLLFYLLSGVVLLSYLYINGLDNNLNSIGIIIASQIAGIAVYKNILHSIKMKEREENQEVLKSGKVLAAYFSHLYDLSKVLHQGIEDLKSKVLFKIVILKGENLPQDAIIDLSQLKEEIRYVNTTIETMLNDSFSKNSDFGVIDFLLMNKGRFVFMLYTLDRVNQDLTVEQIVEELEAMLTSIIEFNTQSADYAKRL